MQSFSKWAMASVFVDSRRSTAYRRRQPKPLWPSRLFVDQSCSRNDPQPFPSRITKYTDTFSMLEKKTDVIPRLMSETTQLDTYRVL